MGYTAEQRKVITLIKRIGQQRGESKKEIKAALLTGRIEANFRNPKVATDHDSLGWRQERQMYYKNPTNLKASINRFFDETSAKNNGRGMKSYQLAQAVQRSAFPERYQTAHKEAERLLRGIGGQAAPTPQKATPEAPAPSENPFRTYVAQRNKPGALLELASGLKQAEASGLAAAPKPKELVPASSGGRVGGSSPKRAVQNVTHGVGLKGLTMTSAKRSRVTTASGNVSDHYVGNKSAWAEDYAGSPKAMDSFARNVARQLGIKNYKPGRIYNITKNGYRYQLIWGTSDHRDHVHVGAKKV